MVRLGYYAKNKITNDLFQFEWDADCTFNIFKDGEKQVAFADDYEILEIGFFTDN